MEGVARPLALVPGVSGARDSARRAMLVKDLHDVAFLTADLDRLIAFYERIFDARVVLDGEDSGRRHALIEIGLHTMLHPFQVPAGEAPGRQRISSAAGWTTSRSPRRVSRRFSRSAADWVVWERKAELAEYVAAALSGADFPFARWNVVADL